MRREIRGGVLMGLSAVAVVGLMVCVTLLLIAWRTDGSEFAQDMTAVATAVMMVLTLIAVIPQVRKPRPTDAPTRPAVVSWPPDSHQVEVQVSRVLVAIDRASRGLESDLGETPEAIFVRNAVTEVNATLERETARRFSARLNRLGFDPSLLVGSLRGHERAASAWDADDPDGTLARARDRLRDLLLESLESDRATFLEPNARSFFHDVRRGGRKFSQEWAGVLPLLNARFGMPAAPAERTKAEQARELLRLPLTDREIIGREKDLADAAALMEQQMNTAKSGVVWMTGEQSGVGASALAKELARKFDISPLFPRGVFYLDLHGLDPQRMSDEEVARSVLSALGARPGGRPFVAYEAAMRGQGVLLVLDHAKDGNHVATLARQIPTCCVLVTSRKQTQLNTTFVQKVPHLPRKDSVALLRKYTKRLPGRGRWTADLRKKCKDLSEYCADVPLALHLVGAQIQNLPSGMSLSDHLDWLKGQLRNESSRLNALQVPEPAIDTAVQLSYGQLSPFEMHVFRMCHAARPRDVTARELAICLGLEREEKDIEGALAKLADISLARQQFAPAGEGPLAVYSLFDLVRLFAADRRREKESPKSVAKFIRRYVLLMRDSLTVLNQGGTAPAARRAVDPRLAGDETPITTAIQLALEHGWEDLAVPLQAALNRYRASAGPASGTPAPGSAGLGPLSGRCQP